MIFNDDAVVAVDETDDASPAGSMTSSSSSSSEKKITAKVTPRTMFESRNKNLFTDEAHYKSYLELKIGEEHIATVASEKIASEAFRRLAGGLGDGYNAVDIRGQVIFDGMITSLSNMYATLTSVGCLAGGPNELKLRNYKQPEGTYGSLNLPDKGTTTTTEEYHSFLMSGDDHDNYLYHNSSPGGMNLSSEVATEFYRQRQDLAHLTAEASKHISSHVKLLKFLNPILHSYWSALVRGLQGV